MEVGHESQVMDVTDGLRLFVVTAAPGIRRAYVAHIALEHALGEGDGDLALEEMCEHFEIEDLAALMWRGCNPEDVLIGFELLGQSRRCSLCGADEGGTDAR